jgi:hypothetical protein
MPTVVPAAKLTGIPSLSVTRSSWIIRKQSCPEQLICQERAKKTTATIKDIDATAHRRSRLFALLFAPTPPTVITSHPQDARTRSVAGHSPNAGGGTRTPDTRIMIWRDRWSALGGLREGGSR